MNILQTIITVLSALITISTVIGGIYKFFRKMEKRFDAVEEKNISQEEQLQKINDKVDHLNVRVNTLDDTITKRLCNLEKARKQDLRVQIKDIYYKYLPLKLIPVSELKTVDYAYDLYHNTYNGNSYIADLYVQIHAWEIVPDNDERVKF